MRRWMWRSCIHRPGLSEIEPGMAREQKTGDLKTNRFDSRIYFDITFREVMGISYYE